MSGHSYLKVRPRCQSEAGEECNRPARFVVRSPAGIHLTCGYHARMYIARALSPFRIKDWPAIQREVAEFKIVQMVSFQRQLIPKSEDSDSISDLVKFIRSLTPEKIVEMKQMVTDLNALCVGQPG